MIRPFVGGMAVVLVSSIAISSAQQKPASLPVDDAALKSPESRNQDWLSYGRNYHEQRFSPLDQINDSNVAQLGLAWYADIDTERGQEVDADRRRRRDVSHRSWSVIYDIDARTGKQSGPTIPKSHRKATDACCDVVNRGVARGTARSISARSTAA